MLKAPATISELVELVSSARAVWEALLVSLQPRDYEQPGVAGEWSLKDIIAHIAWFENEMEAAADSTTASSGLRAGCGEQPAELRSTAQ